MKLAFWKPRKSGDGNAAIFELNEESGIVWLNMMPQDGDGFNSKAKGCTKLGLNDFADFLAVLTGRKEGLGNLKDNKWSGLYHKSGQGNDSSIIGLSRGQYGWQLSLSISRGGNTSRYSVGLTDGECELLRLFFEEMARRAMWVSNEVPNQRSQEPVAAASDDHPF